MEVFFVSGVGECLQDDKSIGNEKYKDILPKKCCMLELESKMPFCNSIMLQHTK